MLPYPVLTRLYRVEDSGYLQIYSSILSFAIVIAALRLEFTILLPADEETAANLVAGALSCVLILTAIVAVVARRAEHSSVSLGRAQRLKP